MSKQQGNGVDVFVVDLGFSSAKYLYGTQKGRIPSAFRSQAGGIFTGRTLWSKQGLVT